MYCVVLHHILAHNLQVALTEVKDVQDATGKIFGQKSLMGPVYSSVHVPKVGWGS